MVENSKLIQSIQALSAEIMPENVLATLVETLVDLTRAEQVCVWLENDGRCLLTVSGTRRGDDVLVDLSPPPFALAESTALTKVLDDRDLLLIDDARHDDRTKADPYVMSQHIKSLLAMSISYHDTINGVVTLEDRTRTGAFTEETAQLLEYVRVQAGIALENARCYQSLQVEADRRRRTEEILHLVTEATANVIGGDFLKSLVQNLAQAFGVRMAFVTECTDQARTRVRTLAVVDNDTLQSNFEYDVEGTPCLYVVGGDAVHFPENLSNIFPKEDDFEAYMGAPVRDSAGEIIGHLVIMHTEPFPGEFQELAVMKIFASRAGAEIERKRAEEALSASEHRYRTLYNRTPVMLQSIGRDGRLLSVSDYWLEVLGYTRAEVIGRSPADFMTAESRQHALTTAIPEFFEQGASWNTNYQFVKKNGEIIDTDLSAIAEYNVDGDFVRALAVLIDVTERNQLEGERQRAYETLEQRVIERTAEIERRQQVAESLRDMLAVLNSNRKLGEILDTIVGEACRLLGANTTAIYRLDAAAGLFRMQSADGEWAQNVVDLSFPDDYAQKLRSSEPVAIADVHPGAFPQAAGGDSVWRAFLCVPLWVTAEVYGCLALYYDVTRSFASDEIELAVIFADQAALAIENARLRQRVEESAITEERNRLARELHDSVTQSLYSLSLMAEGWRRQALSGTLAETSEALGELGDISQQALREMRQLVHELRPVALEQEGLIGALHQRLQVVEKRAGIDARIIADDLVDLPVEVESALYRIALEALNNALKHAAPTSVQVRIQTSGDTITLEIVDDGCGFDPEQTLTDGGIGLNSIRERVAQLDGVLAIDTTPGGGTTVRVTLSRT